MIRTGRKKEWSVFLFVVSLLVFSPPIFSIFDIPDLVFDIPVSFLYLYGLWGLVILFTAIGARRRAPLSEIEPVSKPDEGGATPEKETS
jgi:hypothetical protein